MQIGFYKDFAIYKEKGGWIAKSEKYQQMYGSESKSPDDGLIRTAIRTLEKVYSSQEIEGCEKLRLR